MRVFVSMAHNSSRSGSG